MSMMLGELGDARVLDLFAGSGALGLETLSRGAAHATFVEKAGGALKTLRANVEKLDAGALCTIVRGDALKFVEKLEPGAYDVVVADPPYGTGEGRALAEAFLRRPFAGSLWIEHRVTDALPDAAGRDSRKYGDTQLTRYEAPE